MLKLNQNVCNELYKEHSFIKINEIGIDIYQFNHTTLYNIFTYVNSACNWRYMTGDKVEHEKCLALLKELLGDDIKITWGK